MISPPALTPEMLKKQTQFVLIFDLLKRGQPLSDYASTFNVLDYLQFDLPKHHWNVNSGWEIADSIKAVVDDRLRERIQESTFFSVSCDEVTSIANEVWISIHIYLLKSFSREPLLLCCKRVAEDCNSINVARVITESLIQEGGLTRDQIAQRFISFGADGAAVFQGQKGGVTKRIVESTAPFLVGHHCVAHRVQLAAQKLGILPIVDRLEELCNGLYSYFAKSPKRQLAFKKLAEELATSGNKILRNVKMRWLSLLDPMIRVLEEFKTLVALMDECPSELAKKNLLLLCNFETLLSLAAFIPLLGSVNQLIKFAQLRHVYICDFVNAVKHCQAELHAHFVDPATAFGTDRVFNDFHKIIEDRSDCVELKWLPDMETEEMFLNYNIKEANHNCYRVAEDGRKVYISQVEFDLTIADVKRQATGAAMLMISELNTKFPDVDLINALGIVFPQY
jgi:hypothetical protein